MKRKIAACVVLYNPPLPALENMPSYFPFADVLIVIDNSEQRNEQFESLLHKAFPHIIYHFQNANPGIAGALNVAAEIAIQMQCNWLLTMDQDSRFMNDDLGKMIDDIAAIEKQFSPVGIITPFHLLANELNQNFEDDFKVRKVAMTSGNLLNLAAYKCVGGYDERLFMDFVDYEFCLRLRKNKYSIVQNSKVKLKHALGDLQVRYFFGKAVGVSHHNYKRRYYMTRNSLLVGLRHYKTDKKFFYNAVFNYVILEPFLILLYEKNKLKKMTSVVRGIKDFFMQRYTKLA